MKIPLLVAATPSRIKDCAIVRIPEGDWRIVIENWIDSVIKLSPVPFVGTKGDISEQLKLIEPTSIQVCFEVAGSEKNLNVYLEEVRGS